MSTENRPLQVDMFTGKLVDTRSSYRKKLDSELEQPQQQLMFPVNEVIQFGVPAKPWLKNLPAPPMVLVKEDPRTDEEKERDLQHEAEKQTYALFPDPMTSPAEPTLESILAIVIPVLHTLTQPPIEGFRHQARAQRVHLRRREAAA